MGFGRSSAPGATVRGDDPFLTDDASANMQSIEEGGAGLEKAAGLEEEEEKYAWVYFAPPPPPPPPPPCPSPHLHAIPAQEKEKEKKEKRFYSFSLVRNCKVHEFFFFFRAAAANTAVRMTDVTRSPSPLE